MSEIDVVRAAFAAYRAQDREAAEALLADDYVFTSPQDDHIDKAAFMERCFPTADRFVSQDIVELVAAGSGGVFLLYEYELDDGRPAPERRVLRRPGRAARRDAGLLRRSLLAP